MTTERLFTGNFLAVLRGLQSEGALRHEVQIGQLEMFDEMKYGHYLRFCKINFGADALVRYEGEWTFNPEQLWTYYKTSFFFTNEEDAVVFKLGVL
jgi:hypothetical protein